MVAILVGVILGVALGVILLLSVMVCQRKLVSYGSALLQFNNVFQRKQCMEWKHLKYDI